MSASLSTTKSCRPTVLPSESCLNKENENKEVNEITPFRTGDAAQWQSANPACPNAECHPQLSTLPLPSCLLNSENKQRIKCLRKGCVPFLDLILGISLVFVLLPQMWWWNFRNITNINSFWLRNNRQLQMFTPIPTARISAWESAGQRGGPARTFQVSLWIQNKRNGRNCVK